jgi:hypothetical protein
MFAIKSGPVMRTKQFHIRHETVIRRDTICQTESVALLDSWVTKTASCQDIVSTKKLFALVLVSLTRCVCYSVTVFTVGANPILEHYAFIYHLLHVSA